MSTARGRVRETAAPSTACGGPPPPLREGGFAPGHAAFAGLDGVGPLLLAVSGGPDSMALLRMAAAWTGAPLHVATVDHGLRAEAAAEAAFVAAAAADLGLPHAVLRWDGPKPTTGVQARARAARYALLAEHARAIGASRILTAHHADDQAETVLLRLGRGSGVGGLAGMRRETPLGPGLTLVRPLLDRTKAELIALCDAAGQTFVGDPSNLDPAYARARLRGEAAALARLGLDRDGLNRLARRMARAEDALEAETARLEAALAPAHDADGYRIALAGARNAEPEILLRLLRRAIEPVATAAVRLDRLETLAEAVATALAAGTVHRATLAGTRIVLSRDRMLAVTPEPPRRRGRPAATATSPSLRPNRRAP